MNTKNELGQFMTTNYKYILQNLKIPIKINKIIEPFVGNGDLLNFISKNNYSIECYDIEPKFKNNYYTIIQQDTLLDIPDYKDKFVLTNPPYLAKNKDINKRYSDLFKKYQTDDLYKCFIRILIENNPIGGIIILPLNFWSSIRPSDINLRKEFLNKFNVSLINIFEDAVFDDTNYNICSFQFELNNFQQAINIDIYPSKKKIKNIILNKKNNYIIGGQIYNIVKNNKYTITRWTDILQDKTNILVRCIDKWIEMKFVPDNELFLDNTPKKSARTFMTLIIDPMINDKMQKKLVDEFNNFLNNYRKKYHSLFLTNYRDNYRKRISFDLVYKIVGELLKGIHYIPPKNEFT